MDYPSIMRRTQGVAVVAVFSALVVGSDFVLYPYYNVKLLDTLVFVAAYVFGFRIGAGVAIVSETAWSFASPIGMAGVVTPFLVGGELLFAAAGWWASRVWGGRSRPLTSSSLFIGAIMLICAFLWDLETNAATALIANWPALTAQNLLATEALGVPFALAHEGADFVFGMIVVPATIMMIPRMLKRRV
jgi:hypothetical protein